MYPLIIPFRPSATIGSHETEILLEDVALTVTACGALLGSKHKIYKVHLTLNISTTFFNSKLSIYHVIAISGVNK